MIRFVSPLLVYYFYSNMIFAILLALFYFRHLVTVPSPTPVSTSGIRFRVVSYNILAELYATKQVPYVLFFIRIFHLGCFENVNNCLHIDLMRSLIIRSVDFLTILH